MARQFALAKPCDVQGAVIVFARDPLPVQCHLKKSGAERSADVGLAFAPVKTTVGEAAAHGAGCCDVDSQRLKGFCAGGSEVQCAVR